MKIAIGADHAGFLLKEELRSRLEHQGHQVMDEGTRSSDSCDYPDFAYAVARDVVEQRADRGILVCATGVGMSIAANKVPGIRAAMGVSLEEVRLTRSHNDANILTLGARYTDRASAERMIDIFLSTGFDGGRHARRLGKIAAIETTCETPESKS